ncbi:MAG: arylsulfatase, partial [Segetibacter sp.]|nr:arylsulfatase [Segetibacter sp.]
MKLNFRNLFYFLQFSLAILTVSFSSAQSKPGSTANIRPNILLIYADDLGYGDLSCYGATKIKTPNIDKVASQGLLFTNAHATSATCTPSRYSMMTGEYAWRKKGTGIAPGNASLLIDTAKLTLPAILKNAKYNTAIIGKWHLGLGTGDGPQWNSEIKPGPLELGFNSSFIIPATVDRVPCVYVEGHRVLNLDPKDPIEVSYKEPIGNWPTGLKNPELLKMKPSHGHNQTIVNGISRIGYMTGGKSALWTDEDIANVLVKRSISFLENNRNNPFFLFVSTHDIHVPRAPHANFAGKSGLGMRGDVILQFDWTVGEILNSLDRLGLANNTMVIISSDNGPVVDDGYQDGSVENLNGHPPAGVLRGGKYSAFDGGTRVPLIIRWPKVVSKGLSDAAVSQVDFLASFAVLTGQKYNTKDAPDSKNTLNVFLGKSKKDRDQIIEQSLNNTLSIIEGTWKYIEPGQGPAKSAETGIELGNNTQPQLYDLNKDKGEKNNLAKKYPEKVKAFAAKLGAIKSEAGLQQ